MCIGTQAPTLTHACSHTNTDVRRTRWARGAAQLWQVLPCTHKALGPMPSTTRIKCGGAHFCRPIPREAEAGGSEVHGWAGVTVFLPNLREALGLICSAFKTEKGPQGSQPYSDFEGSYMRSYLKTQKSKRKRKKNTPYIHPPFSLYPMTYPSGDIPGLRATVCKTTRDRHPCPSILPSVPSLLLTVYDQSRSQKSSVFKNSHMSHFQT